MSEDSNYSEINGGWITWFCSLEDHQFLCEVDHDYIKDPFNLYGLKHQFPKLDECLKMILSPSCPEDDELSDEKFLQTYQEATDVYGAIHRRFITTVKGLGMMREKYKNGKFGTCPRILCEKQNVLPIGNSDEFKVARVKIYCPKCMDVYQPKKKCQDVDGAFFGTSYPQIMLLNYEDTQPINKKVNKYTPKIYGFQIFNPDEQVQQENESKQLANITNNKSTDKQNKKKNK